MWNLALSLKDNIAQGFSCAILYILPGVSRQHCTKFFVCIAVWGSSQTKLQKTTNFHKENNQCNLVSIMLGKYCLGILCSQFCVNTTKTLQCWPRARSYVSPGRSVIQCYLDLPGLALHRQIT